MTKPRHRCIIMRDGSGYEILLVRYHSPCAFTVIERIGFAYDPFTAMHLIKSSKTKERIDLERRREKIRQLKELYRAQKEKAAHGIEQ
jgi:hypothetical protein